MFSIIPTAIKLPQENTLISVLKGLDDLYLENPWFSVDKTEANMKFLLNQRESKMGTIFAAPRLFIRDHQSGKFSSRYLVQYTDTETQRKTFAFKKPYIPEQNRANWPNKYKFSLSVKPKIKTDTDTIMERIDYITCAATEFVFIGVKSKFSPSQQCAHDATLINEIFAHLGCPADELKELLSEDYFKYFLEPPTWQNVIGASGYREIMNNREDDKYDGLFDVVRFLLKNRKTAQRTKEKFDKVAMNILLMDNIRIVPNIKRIKWTLNGKDEDGKPTEKDFSIVDYNLSFYIKIPGLTPDKFPERLLCTAPKRGQPNKLMTLDEFQSLYGVTAQTSYDSVKFPNVLDCFTFIGNEIELSIYARGQPKSSWVVKSIIYSKSNQQNAQKSSIIKSFMFDDDDDAENPGESANVPRNLSDLMGEGLTGEDLDELANI